MRLWELPKYSCLHPGLGDATVANRFRRICFLWPHLWQSWCCEDRGWLTVPQRRALWPDSVCGGRWQTTLQEVHTYLKTCGIGSIDSLVNKCKGREKVHEERVEHTRITNGWTVALKAKRTQNTGAVSHRDWTHITGCKMIKWIARAHAIVSEIDMIHLCLTQLHVFSRYAVLLCFSLSLCQLHLFIELFSNEAECYRRVCSVPRTHWWS